MREDDDRRLSIARGRLTLAAPYLAALAARLTPEPRAGLAMPGTDGAHFLYDPGWLEEAFGRDGGVAVATAIAHAMAHCLLGHVFDPAWQGPEGALAADMAAALLVDARLPDFLPARREGLFLEARRRLRGAGLAGVAAVMAADGFFRENREALAGLLALDDHRLWRPETPGAPASGGAGAGWRAAARALPRTGEGGRMGLAPGTVRRRVRLGDGPSRSYRALLERWAVEREFPREDMDAFQPGLYAHGLRLYGDMPLVEPAETREERRIEELAVVIDTSGSCVRELTVRFLEETRAMLSDETLFFPRFHLRILQCDARVQREDRINCLRDFEKYIDGLEIVGGGGTDFRPAFERIDALVARGAFRSLPGAVFFSDGQGIFPKNPPAWEPVFGFFEGRYDDIDVPKWVRRCVLDGEQGRYVP